jgi:Flp pilus assembly protein TadD
VQDALNLLFEPTSSQLLVQAMAHQHQGELDRAKSLVWQILADDPENIPGLTKLGVLSAANGDFEKAEAVYRQVLSLVPDDVRVLTILGNLLVNRNAIGEALSTFH